MLLHRILATPRPELGEKFVAPKPMIKKIVLTISIVVLFALNSLAGEVQSHQAISPILNLEVVNIPSKGKVVSVTGDAELKKDNINEYKKVIVGTTVNENDILWLKKESTVKIEFTDGSYILNEKHEKDIFITFEVIKSINSKK